MSRELSDVLIILIAILIPTLAIIGGIGWSKWLRHREHNDEVAAENRTLRAELAVVASRVADVERIVTDDAHRLGHEIDALRLAKN